MGNKNSKHNVIFIDIDGVLNSLEFHNRDRSKKKLFDRECVKRLAEIVDEFDCLVVLASTWIVLNTKEKVRIGTKQEDGAKSSSAMYFKLLNELQSAGIILYDQIEDEHIRPIGINDWLKENIEIVENYAIIDDDYRFDDYVSMGNGLENHLVSTEYFCDIPGGIQKEHLEKIRNMLNNKNKHLGSEDWQEKFKRLQRKIDK